MILIGLTGDIGSGKTSFAAYLNRCAPGSHHMESSELISEVANDLRTAHRLRNYPSSNDIEGVNEWLSPLPAIIKARLGVAVPKKQLVVQPALAAKRPELYQKLFAYLDSLEAQPTLQEEHITAATKSRHRALLQWLGGYLPHQIDSQLWYRELVKRALHARGAPLVTIGGVRYPADAACLKNAGGLVLQLSRPHLTSRDPYDITERERDLIRPAAIIHNNGTLYDLERCAERVWADLQRDALQPLYYAKGD